MVFLVACDEGSSHRGDHELRASCSHKVRPGLVFWTGVLDWCFGLVFWTAQATFQTSGSLLLERPL